MSLKRGLFTKEKKQQKQQSNTSRLLRKDKLSKDLLILLVMGYDKIKKKTLQTHDNIFSRPASKTTHLGHDVINY